MHVGRTTEFFNNGGRAATLPHNGVTERKARARVPYHRGFALVGNTKCRDILSAYALRFHEFTQHANLRAQDIEGVVLDPTRLGKMLFKSLLGHALHFALRIYKKRATARCTLVKRDNKLRHFSSRSISFDGDSYSRLQGSMLRGSISPLLLQAT